MHGFKSIIEAAGYGIEAVGVLIIVLGSLIAVVRFGRGLWRPTDSEGYRELRRDLGRSIILGLEFLIAGDIIRTVVVSDTLSSVAVLALIILMRTFLSLTLHLEVEGRWPWQSSRESGGD
jgi:uncharacterized membrane protein